MTVPFPFSEKDGIDKKRPTSCQADPRGWSIMESAESVNPVMRISALHRGQAKKAALGTSYRRRVGLTFRTKPSPPAPPNERLLRLFSLYPGVFSLSSDRAFRTTDSMEVARYNQPLLVGFKCGDGVTVYPQETALFKMQADINGLNSPSVEPLSGILLIPPNSGKRNYVWSKYGLHCLRIVRAGWCHSIHWANAHDSEVSARDALARCKAQETIRTLQMDARNQRYFNHGFARQLHLGRNRNSRHCDLSEAASRRFVQRNGWRQSTAKASMDEKEARQQEALGWGDFA